MAFFTVLLPFLHFFHLSLLLSCTQSGFSQNIENSQMKCVEKERQALLSSKERIDDPPNHLSSWSSGDRNCCKWTGVKCDNRTGRVFMLDLRSPEQEDGITAIGGEISPALLELKYLTCLDLSFFRTYTIPEFIGSLSRLKYLNLLYGSFGGKIPYQLGNLSSLETLDISNNINDLYVNNLDWLSKLVSLQFLHFGSINFTGVPDWIERLKSLPSLTSLYMILCQFPDQVDSRSLSFAKPSDSLRTLYIDDIVRDPLALPWLFNMSTKLANLTLTWNKLTGPIPDSFEDMKFLVNVDLSNNQLEGGIPKSLGNLCSLKTLDISWNNLSVSLQDLLKNFSMCAKNSLEILRLNDNKLYGPLHGITAFRSLKELLLSGNKLDGVLPHFFQNLSKLETLILSGNKLHGVLPESLGQISTLRALDLASNNLSGVISDDNLSNVSSLQELDLSFNSLALNFSAKWVPPFQLNTEIEFLQYRPQVSKVVSLSE